VREAVREAAREPVRERSERAEGESAVRARREREQ
jgi:hypothetical protein